MIEKLYRIWENSPINKKIMVLTGSEIAVSSGIDLYKKQNKQQISEFWGKTSHILNKNNLIQDPLSVWEWVLDKRKKLVHINPNENHYAILKLEQHFKENFYLITDTIDNLHSHLGHLRLIELNGNVFEAIPFAKGDNINIDSDINIPKKNKELLRPNIVLAGEKVNKKKFLQAHLFAQQCDICIVVGSQIEQSPFNELPLVAKKFRNAYIIEINSKKSYIEDCDIFIKSTGENILPILVNLMIELEEGFKKVSTK